MELVRKTVVDFQRGAMGEVLDAASDDVVFYRAEPEGAYFKGKDGFLRALAEWSEGFDAFDVAVEELIDAGDLVVARVRQSARIRGSEVPVVGDYWFLYGFRDGKVVRLDIYARRDDALAAAGMAR